MNLKTGLIMLEIWAVWRILDVLSVRFRWPMGARDYNDARDMALNDAVLLGVLGVALWIWG